MHGEFLLGAGLVLGALALAGLVFHRLRQSVIPAFILLGIAARGVQGHSEVLEELAGVGVVLLLFFMGLEFSLGALLRNRRRITRNGLVDLALSFPAGLVLGLLAGFGWLGALILAGAFYATSSAIVAKATIELRRSANPETEVALGVLVFEDLVVAVLLALLSGAAAGQDATAVDVLLGIGKAAGFFAVVLAAARLGRPVLDRVFRVESDDLFILLTGAVVLLVSWAALMAGLSEAIGGFLAGLALAETPHRERIERVFAPLQGVFAALFFLAFGLSLDPAAFLGAWPVAVAAAVLGIATKVAAGWWIGRMEGLPRGNRLALGLTLAPRGEFSVILAGVAATAGIAGLNAAIGLMVLLLALVGTVGMRYAPELARRIFPRKKRPPLAVPGEPAPPGAAGGGVEIGVVRSPGRTGE